MVKGIHRFTLEKYSLCKGIGRGKSILSDVFIVGGHKWAIVVYPDGTPEDQNVGESRYERGHVYLDLLVTCLSETGDNGVSIHLEMKLLDQSEWGIDRRRYNAKPDVISTNENRGFLCFIDREVLEKSSYLKDDCIKIECGLSVLLPSDEKIQITKRDDDDDDDNDDDDVGVDFLRMLTSGEGSDIVLKVGRVTLRAHKAVLSARSSVLFKESSSMFSDQQEIVVKEVEPLVFKALLHFIYSDTLPKKEKRSLVDGYAFGGPSVSSTIGAKLLAAADKYDVKRLKSLCESHLWRSISLSRFAEIVSLAGKHNASELKHLCFKYAADNYDVLVELGSFSYLENNCPSLFSEMNDYISRERLSKERSSSFVETLSNTYAAD